MEKIAYRNVKILALCKYGRKGASSRYRLYQYLPYLKQYGFKISVSPLFNDDYLTKLYEEGGRNILGIIKAYIKQTMTALKFKHFDLLWIQGEILPWFPDLLEAIIRFFRIPYIVDYDDAIFHNYDMHKSKIVRLILRSKIDKVMNKATLVLVGNDYIAARAKKSGAQKVKILPTVIDLNRYNFKSHTNDSDKFIIGWVGSPSTVRYLYSILPVLQKVSSERNVEIRVIGAKGLNLPKVEIRYIPWSEETEVEEIRKFDVGIMPLINGPWERGKCGLKLLQYMGCALPVVGSPVGINKKIIRDGFNGYYATTHGEWVKALLKLKQNRKLRHQMGKNGRNIVEKEYSLQRVIPYLARLLSFLRS